MLFLLALALLLRVDASRVGGSNLTTCGCQPRYYSTAIAIPVSYDLRVAYPGTMTPIRNQGECGCCWAFSTTSVLADRFSIAAYKLNRTVRRLLSPQTMLDCSTGCLSSGQCNMGCNGGYNTLAISFFNATGVVGENCRPYQASQQTCPAVACASGVTSQRYHSSICYSLETVSDIQRDIMAHGPVVAGLQIYVGFDNYTGGVFTVTSPVTKGGHAVRLIGWGVENGVPYWLAANQWTTWWGEKGYFRIRRGTNEATIEDYVIAMEPSLNLLTEDENVDYMSTCSDCVTQRQAPNSDPIFSFIPDTGVTWPGGLSDTTAISLIVLGICGVLGCLASIFYCRKPKRLRKADNNDQELQRVIEESKREQRSQSVARPLPAGDPELELAIALSQLPSNNIPVRLSNAHIDPLSPPAYPPYGNRLSNAAQPHRLSSAAPPQLVTPMRHSVGGAPFEGPQAARVRAATRLEQSQPEVKNAMAVSQRNAQEEARRRMTREEADLQLAIQLSQAEQQNHPPYGRKDSDDIAFALALSRGDGIHGVEG